MMMLHLNADGLIIAIQLPQANAPEGSVSKQLVPDASKYHVGQNLYMPNAKLVVEEAPVDLPPVLPVFVPEPNVTVLDVPVGEPTRANPFDETKAE